MLDSIGKLETISTGRQFPVPSMAKVAVSDMQVIELEPQGFGVRNEYRLKIDIGITFTCGNLEREMVERDARKQLHRLLYASFIERLDKAIMATHEEDKSTALRNLYEIMSVCTGEEVQTIDSP